ncbi:hypothetical protein LTR54_018505, partial [Friedmanniomyces endolithicus]
DQRSCSCHADPWHCYPDFFCLVRMEGHEDRHHPSRAFPEQRICQDLRHLRDAHLHRSDPVVLIHYLLPRP